MSVNNVLPKQGEGEEGGLGAPKKGSSHLPSREGEFERKIHFIDRTGLPRLAWFTLNSAGTNKSCVFCFVLFHLAKK